jgi:hypothetical protein
MPLMTTFRWSKDLAVYVDPCLWLETCVILANR